jgi:hypothetical protein
MLVFVLAICNVAAAQSVYQFSPFKGSALEQYRHLKKDSLSYVKEDSCFYFEMYGTIMSFMCEYDRALNVFDKRINSTGSFSLDTIRYSQKNYCCIDAKKEILRLAAQHDVLLLNDIHHYPAPRIFLYDILDELRKLGYKYIALEALNEQDTLLGERKYPVVGLTGVYTNEPTFGELVRKALELGFTLIPYDYGFSNMKDRYTVSCSNILSSIKGVNLDESKLIVFGGYGNIEEKTKNRLGYLLGNALNQDVLSIKSNVYAPRGLCLDNGEFKYLVNEFKIEAPSIIKHRTDKRGECYLTDGTVDVTIVTPEAYLSKMYSILSYKKGICSIPENIRAKVCYMTITLDGELNGVPIYQVLVKPNSAQVSYYTAKNRRCTLKLMDELGGVLYKVELL